MRLYCSPWLALSWLAWPLWVVSPLYIQAGQLVDTWSNFLIPPFTNLNLPPLSYRVHVYVPDDVRRSSFFFWVNNTYLGRVRQVTHTGAVMGTKGPMAVGQRWGITPPSHLLWLPNKERELMARHLRVGLASSSGKRGGDEVTTLAVLTRTVLVN